MFNRFNGLRGNNKSFLFGIFISFLLLCLAINPACSTKSTLTQNLNASLTIAPSLQQPIDPAWQDIVIHNVFLRIEQAYEPNKKQFSNSFAFDTVQRILAKLGVRVVNENESNDAVLTISLKAQQLKVDYYPNGKAGPLAAATRLGYIADTTATLTSPGLDTIKAGSNYVLDPGGVVWPGDTYRDWTMSEAIAPVLIDSIAQIWGYKALLAALEDGNLAVREGAVWQLQEYSYRNQPEEVVITLSRMAENDESADVREAAHQALNNQQLIELVSLQVPPYINNGVGEPFAEVTVKNLAAQPIISLTVSLSAFTRYLYCAFNVSSSNPLMPLESTSARFDLTDGDFTGLGSTLSFTATLQDGTQLTNELNVVVGDSQLFNASIQGWEWLPRSPITPCKVLGWSSSDLFIMDEIGSIAHYDGNTWTVIRNDVPGQELSAIWGTSFSDVFAVGSEGAILHYDGKSWSKMNSGTTKNLLNVWGISASNVFVVGEYGTILHYDGQTWNQLISNTTARLLSVWGSSSDIFAVGGTIIHYDGITCSEIKDGATQYLDSIYGDNYINSVWGTSPSNVYAVGNSGYIFHYDGKTWAVMKSGTDKSLFSIWGVSSSDIFAVGDSCTILNYNGNAWNVLFTLPIKYYGFYDIWGDSSTDIFTSGDAGILRYSEVK